MIKTIFKNLFCALAIAVLFVVISSKSVSAVSVTGCSTYEYDDIRPQYYTGCGNNVYHKNGFNLSFSDGWSQYGQFVCNDIG